MNGESALEDPIPGLRAGGSPPPSATGLVARLLETITPELRQDPRTALRDMRVKPPLRTVLSDPARSGDLSLEDETADDPYADSDGITLTRQFSVLKSQADKVVLLQIPDWIAKDGGKVGALTEIRDAFMNGKVRIVAHEVPKPDISLQLTLPRIWRNLANIDVEFISWDYVVDMQQGKYSPAQVFGLAAGTASTAQPSARPAKPVKRVFIGSTGLDLKEYRAVARDACLDMDFMPIMMEHFEAMGLGATAGSRKKLDQADLYVGIFAYRYGYVEKGYPASVTEIEFDYAAQRGIERLCFMVDPKHPWPTDTLDFEHHEQMEKFKQRVGTLIRGQFTTPDNFKAMVTAALVPHRP